MSPTSTSRFRSLSYAKTAKLSLDAGPEWTTLLLTCGSTHQNDYWKAEDWQAEGYTGYYADNHRSMLL
jgi:hypothetical protein